MRWPNMLGVGLLAVFMALSPLMVAADSWKDESGHRHRKHHQHRHKHHPKYDHKYDHQHRRVERPVIVERPVAPPTRPLIGIDLGF